MKTNSSFMQKLQTPRASGLGALWKKTLKKALLKGVKDKKAGLSPGIEALALVAVDSMLKGHARLKGTEKSNKVIWMNFVQHLVKDRAQNPQIQLEDDIEDNVDVSIINDPDEMLASEMERQRKEGVRTSNSIGGAIESSQVREGGEEADLFGLEDSDHSDDSDDSDDSVDSDDEDSGSVIVAD